MASATNYVVESVGFRVGIFKLLLFLAAILWCRISALPELKCGLLF